MHITAGGYNSKWIISSVHFGPLTDQVVGRNEGQFSRYPLPVISAGSRCEQFWHGQGRRLFDIVRSAFLPLVEASATLQGVLKDGFGEVVEACDGNSSSSFFFFF